METHLSYLIFSSSIEGQSSDLKNYQSFPAETFPLQEKGENAASWLLLMARVVDNFVSLESPSDPP